MNKKILKGVEDYYTGKLALHGNTSMGVDWNSKESQYLRFAQLCKVISGDSSFRILDYGCGLGELINYINTEFVDHTYSYTGYDVSEKMIEQALAQFGKLEYVNLQVLPPFEKMDYVVASGIFNVKPDSVSDSGWLEYILETLDVFNRLSEKGFSFNMLTKYSDSDFMKEHLYYADPLFIFDHCKRKYARNVALLHDYNLYEFTIIVRK